MKGTVSSFRRGRHTQTTNQMIVVVGGFDKKEKASELVGKTVTWKSPAGKEIKGKVASTHGNKGAIRVLFQTGMPGQAITTKVNIE